MTNMLSGYASVNGARLYYEIAGKGRPLVLVHGFALDRRLWDFQFEVFAQHYEVLRYDLRGFGKSEVSSDPYAHHADLKALLTHLDIARADVVGLSLGGMVVTDFALSYPDSIHSLITVNGLIAGFHWTEEWNMQTKRVWDAARENGIDAAKEAWLAHPLFGAVYDQSEAAALLTQMVTDYSGWHFVNENPNIPLKPPAAQRLAEINTPALIVLGERDLPDFHNMAEAMAQQIAGARKVVLPNVGHMANMEDPAGFNRAALEFLAGI